MLERLIRQDVEEKPGGGCQIKEGTEKDRLISVHDTEMRHGRKSASKTFNGHKAAVAVDMESQLICGVEVLAGNAGDQEKALDLVHQAERVTEAKVEETVGDCAYGGSPTRKAFADEQRQLTAKVPTSHNGECFPKSAFAIDLDRMEVRCPAGQTTTAYESQGIRRGGHFLFPDATCQACSLRSQCVRGQGGRSISIQPEERLQQQARTHNQTQAGKQLGEIGDSSKPILWQNQNPLSSNHGRGRGEHVFGGGFLPSRAEAHHEHDRSRNPSRALDANRCAKRRAKWLSC